MHPKLVFSMVGAFPLLLSLAATAQTSTPAKAAHSKAGNKTSSKAASHAAPHAEDVLVPLDPQQRVIQMLNRFTFGPRPGDIDAVKKIGADAWFEAQLNPQAIPDHVMDRRMSDFLSLYLPPSELLAQFPSNQTIRQIADGKRPYPNDPVLAAAYEVLALKSNRGEVDKKAKLSATPPPEMTDEQKRAKQKQQQQQAQVLAFQVLAYPKDQRMQAILKLPVEDREILTGFVQDPQKSLLLNDLSPKQRDIFGMMAAGPDAVRVIDGQLQQVKILRAVLSERQLLEVMTDFWYNHFNVDIRKDAAQWYTPTYERDAIRAHALGKFSDLLLATAKHPAMLYYLDNWSSVGPESQAAGRPNKKQAERGLNENYGREVMELHTVGVDGGYTQADVTNLARILTGWTIDDPKQGGGFVFDPRKHEPGPIKWFGQTIQDSGEAGGQQALLWLAAQPQTAHFISYKLAQRFVADQPPPALVDRMAKTFLDTSGDIKEILRTMVRSPEFNSQKYYRNQVKTPLDFVVSVLRATDTNPTNPTALVQTLTKMGEAPYQMQPPTGYPTTADHWMNSGAIVDRLNFSIQFANSKVGGIKYDAPRFLAEGLLARPALVPSAHGEGHAQSIAVTSTGTPSGQDEALNLMEQMLIGGQVSAKTNAVIKRELSGPPPDVTAAAPASSGAATMNDAGGTMGSSMSGGMGMQPAPAQSMSAPPAKAQTNPAPGQRVEDPDPAQTLDMMTALILGSPEFQMH
jgi:Protein of unknown function (DUF1800)